MRPLYQVSRCCDASDPKNPPHTPDLQLHTQKVLSDTLSNYPNSLIKKTSPMMVLDHVSVQKGSVGAAYGNRIERFKSSEAFVMCGLAATNCSAGCCVRPVFQITVPLLQILNRLNRVICGPVLALTGPWCRGTHQIFTKNIDCSATTRQL
jgi:hypothetical protein